MSLFTLWIPNLSHWEPRKCCLLVNSKTNTFECWWKEKPWRNYRFSVVYTVAWWCLFCGWIIWLYAAWRRCFSQYSFHNFWLQQEQNQFYCSGKWLSFINICSFISLVFCLFWRPETCQSPWRRWRPDHIPVSVQRQHWLMRPLSSGLKRLCRGNPLPLWSYSPWHSLHWLRPTLVTSVIGPARRANPCFCYFILKLLTTHWQDTFAKRMLLLVCP